jgi:hypothetical protein
MTDDGPGGVAVQEGGSTAGPDMKKKHVKRRHLTLQQVRQVCVVGGCGRCFLLEHWWRGRREGRGTGQTGRCWLPV